MKWPPALALHKKQPWFLALLSLLMLTQDAEAQRSYVPPKQSITLTPKLHFRNITKGQGIPGTGIRSVTQDSLGFVWIGGTEFLTRYDGSNFEVFHKGPKDDPSTLSSDFVTALTPGPKGTVWIGTGDGGLNYYDPDDGHFEAYRQSGGGLPSDGVTALLDHGGQIWVGTTEGLAAVDPSTREVSTVMREYRGGILSITAIAAVGQNELWLGTEKAGLFLLDTKSGESTHYDPRIGQHVTALLRRESGELWVGTAGDGLWVLPSREGSVRRVPVRGRRFSEVLDTVYPTTMLEGADGRIWIGTRDSGLFRYVADEERLLQSTPDRTRSHTSLPTTAIATLYQDAGDVLWVGTQTGLATLNPWRLRYDHYVSLGDQPAAVREEGGPYWIASAKGLVKYDESTSDAVLYGYPPLASAEETPAAEDADSQEGTTEESTEADADKELWITDMAFDGEGRVWLASRSRGLMRFDPSSETFVHHYVDDTAPGLAGLFTNDIFSVHVDTRQGVWAGTWGGGLARLRTIDSPDGPDARFVSLVGLDIASDYVYTVRGGAEGPHVLWIGTARGLSRLDMTAQTVTNYVHDPDDPKSLGNNAVLSVLADDPDKVWLGTYGGGLNRLDLESDSFARYATEDGLCADVVYGVMRDDSGRLWLTTNDCLARFDPATETFENFRWPGGAEFMQGSYSVTPSGEIVAGGVVDGSLSFVVVDPDRMAKDSYVPPVRMTGFDTITGESESIADRDHDATVSYDAVFNVTFASLAFADPESNRYAYKIAGLSDKWIKLSTGRATLTRLPVGDHELQLRGSNQHGVWNEQGTTLGIHVTPPPWATWWAYAAYVLVGLGALGVAVRYQRARIAALNQKNRLDAVERDLELTGVVQSSFVPKEDHVAEPDFRLRAIYQAADQCSGDWWWHESLTEERRAFVVADVTGHGAGPAMMTVAAATAFRIAAELTGADLAERLRVLNGELYRMTEGRYLMTASAIELDLQSGRFVLYSAGGIPAMKLGVQGRAKALTCAGTPLGTDRLELGQLEGQLSPGERLLILTDGIPETTTPEGRQLGLKRVAKLYGSTRDRSLEEAAVAMLEETRATLGERTQEDDWTFIMVEYKPEERNPEHA